MKEEWRGGGVCEGGPEGDREKEIFTRRASCARRVKRAHGWVRTSLPSQDRLVGCTEQYAGDGRVLM